MKGLSKHTDSVFDFFKDLDILEDYFLIGGTALSVQINHRLSEDLDFCKWQDNQSIRSKEVKWLEIESALKELGDVKTDVLDLYQSDFLVNGVKVSFYSNGMANSREIASNVQFDKVKPADLLSLGAMKLEVMSRRNVFRDYYDVYAILKEGVPLKKMVELCGRYSKHRLRTRMILAILADESRFKYEEKFEQLEPSYKVNSKAIGEFIQTKIQDEFGR
jgi:predicted nucleotidyltransferase component of viral defense system